MSALLNVKQVVLIELKVYHLNMCERVAGIARRFHQQAVDAAVATQNVVVAGQKTWPVRRGADQDVVKPACDLRFISFSLDALARLKVCVNAGN